MENVPCHVAGITCPILERWDWTQVHSSVTIQIKDLPFYVLFSESTVPSGAFFCRVYFSLCCNQQHKPSVSLPVEFNSSSTLSPRTAILNIFTMGWEVQSVEVNPKVRSSQPWPDHIVAGNKNG